MKKYEEEICLEMYLEKTHKSLVVVSGRKTGTWGGVGRLIYFTTAYPYTEWNFSSYACITL